MKLQVQGLFDPDETRIHEVILMSIPALERGDLTCGEPVPFEVFSAHNGKRARDAANAKGLVAIFLGGSRWSLYAETWDFLAVPADLAERLASGEIMALEKETLETREVLLTLLDKGKLTVHVGRKVRYQLTDAELLRDIKRQLRNGLSLEGGGH